MGCRDAQEEVGSHVSVRGRGMRHGAGHHHAFILPLSSFSSQLLFTKLKKIRKTTRPFRYDLSQIPYDYTVEVTNRFKGLDLIDRDPEELWMEVHDVV